MPQPLPALFLGIALLAAAPADIGPLPALAQACYSAGQARAAVSAGQVVPLSSVIKRIKTATGGEILSSPRLCKLGGRLVYLLNVLAAGQVLQVQVDGASGSISY